MTPQIPPEDSFVVAQYLTRLSYHELWSGGRPLITQGYDTNAMRIVNLTGEFSARITHPHEALTFHIPRAALDELADDAGRRRLAHLACTPGIVDSVLVHIAAALLPAFERPQQANSLFVDYVMLAVCSYLADKYGNGAPPVAAQKGGLTSAQLRHAKERISCLARPFYRSRHRQFRDPRRFACARHLRRDCKAAGASGVLRCGDRLAAARHIAVEPL
jgi:AraC family transcriptional regulator